MARQFLAGLLSLSILMPMSVLAQTPAPPIINHGINQGATPAGQGRPSTNWTLPQGVLRTEIQAGDTAPPDVQVPPTANGANAHVPDASEQLLLQDRAFADAIFEQGPLNAYSATISENGVLYDGNGAAPEGTAGVTARFQSFPQGVSFDRRPQSAMASGDGGSSWGIYAVRRGDQIMTEGSYVTVWRKEGERWRIVAELVAGRTAARTSSPAAGATTAPATAPAGANVPPPPPATVPLSGPLPARPAGSMSGPTSSRTRTMRDAMGRPVTPPAVPAPATPQQ